MADSAARGPERVPSRKKKKKKKPPSSQWRLYAGIAGAGVGIAALVLLIWAVARLTGGGPPAKAVTAWEKFTTEENEFGFDYPAGWKAKGYGVHGKREVEVKGDSATITVKENIVGSLVGDIAGALARGPVDDEHSPVAQAHDLRRPRESGHQEEPAVTVVTKLGKARRSEYRDGGRRGYRVTALLHQTALDVFCECRESDWETLRPAFEHVIESLCRG
jgi:hypothetical protein